MTPATKPGGVERPTDAQRRLLLAMGFVPDVLWNNDESTPKWWLRHVAGGIQANVAESCLRRGWIKFTRPIGGPPGIQCFTVTAEGRAALAAQADDATRKGEAS